MLTSCGGTLPASAVPRPFGEDLIAIVPTGAELVIDVDVQQLRSWEAMSRVIALLPPAAQARLAKLGEHWENEIDGLVLASWRGERGTDSVLLIRGDLDDAHLPALLEGTAKRTTMSGKTLYETATESVLRLAPRVIVVASPVDVRRVADVVKGDLPDIRVASADKLLRAALARAPTAKSGRPAVIGAAVGGPLLTERMRGAGLPEHPPQWATFALAVGDGVDAVLGLGLATADDATGLRDNLEKALQDLRYRPVIRILHLEDLFNLALKVKDKELRIAYRVSSAQLEAFLTRMDAGKRALEHMKSQQPH
ncbi:MAG: hypothetical protein ABI321_10795 [Polyangia bacterium]